MLRHPKAVLAAPVVIMLATSLSHAGSRLDITVPPPAIPIYTGALGASGDNTPTPDIPIYTGALGVSGGENTPGPQPSGGKTGEGPKSLNQLAVNCSVVGEHESSDDFWVVNVGDATLEPGTKLRYRVPDSGDHGAFLLPSRLAAGEKLKVRGLLHAASHDAPCIIRILD